MEAVSKQQACQKPEKLKGRHAFEKPGVDGRTMLKQGVLGRTDRLFTFTTM
jgi:hypothetical protein